jgi:hypothetical protein
MTDIVRVLRVIEYVGPRDAIEYQLSTSLHGTNWKYNHAFKADIRISVATIGDFAEILASMPVDGPATQEQAQPANQQAINEAPKVPNASSLMG